MPRNVEVKARIAGEFAELVARLQALADEPARAFEQCDTFFPCPTGTGRLKLRLEEVKLFFPEREKEMRKVFLGLESSSSIDLLRTR